MNSFISLLREISLYFLLGACFSFFKISFSSVFFSLLNILKSFLISFYKKYTVIKNDIRKENRTISIFFLLLLGITSIFVNYALCDGVFRFYNLVFLFLGYKLSKSISAFLFEKLSVLMHFVEKCLNIFFYYGLFVPRNMINALIRVLDIAMSKLKNIKNKIIPLILPFTNKVVLCYNTLKGTLLKKGRKNNDNHPDRNAGQWKKLYGKGGSPKA